MRFAAIRKHDDRDTMSEYSKFWRELNADTAGDAILTGYTGDFDNMPVYSSVMSKLNNVGTLLDFGCGVGRNARYIAKNMQYDQVYGYDFPNMISLVPEDSTPAPIYFTNLTDVINHGPYDEILASLCFQHIHVDELRSLLTELTYLTKRLIVHSRTWLDHTFEPILPILKDFFSLEHISYQRDPNSDLDDHFIAIFVQKF